MASPLSMDSVVVALSLEARPENIKPSRGLAFSDVSLVSRRKPRAANFGPVVAILVWLREFSLVIFFHGRLSIRIGLQRNQIPTLYLSPHSFGNDGNRYFIRA